MLAQNLVSSDRRIARVHFAIHSENGDGLALRFMKNVWLCVLFATAVCISYGQDTASSKNELSQQPGATDALQFLGSYSAPSAIMATETGHTSARPPSPPTNVRLRRIEGGVTLLPPWPEDFAWPVESLEAACRRTEAPSARGDTSRADPPAERSDSFDIEV